MGLINIKTVKLNDPCPHCSGILIVANRKQKRKWEKEYGRSLAQALVCSKCRTPFSL